MMTTAFYQTPIGLLTVTFEDDHLTSLDMAPFDSNARQPNQTVSFDRHYRGLPKRVGEQLRRYFASPQAGFDLPLQQRGTPHQLRVWRALQRIPAGQTLTYGQLAKRLHSSPRAIGNACRQNPLPLLVPCHRVVAATGVGGFAGKTRGAPLALKRWLLRHEGVAV